jgi:hypothetical protein
MRVREKKNNYFAEHKDRMEKVMIERQREVTGNYDDEDNLKSEDVSLEIIF